MGCGCGGGARRPMRGTLAQPGPTGGAVTAGASPAGWVVVYPSGDRSEVYGSLLRARREARDTGGRVQTSA